MKEETLKEIYRKGFKELFDFFEWIYEQPYGESLIAEWAVKRNKKKLKTK